MNDYSEKFFELLNPDMLKEQLILISLFIAVYENFKSTIIENVKYFYWSGYENGKEQFEYYEQDVLSKVKSKKNRQIKATLHWLKEAGAMTEEDKQNFTKITEMRNSLAHNMSATLLEGLPPNFNDLYVNMLGLFEKIIKWWICEIEIPTNPDLNHEQYENICWDEVTSVNLEFLKIMTDIAINSTEKYQQIYRDLFRKPDKREFVTNNVVKE